MKVIILRGAPGSGKSTFVRSLGEGVVCSADDFFLVDGEYRFNAKALGAAHEWCFNRFSEELRNETPLVIVDNTNRATWEFSKYIDLAKSKGYDVEVVRFTAPVERAADMAARNVHGVPENVIVKHLTTVSPYKGERLIEVSF